MMSSTSRARKQSFILRFGENMPCFDFTGTSGGLPANRDGCMASMIMSIFQTFFTKVFLHW